VSRGEWLRGARILRSAPWLPLLGSATVAALLLLVAVLAYRTAFASAATLLGLATCGAVSAYILDEEAAAVADATPTSRRRRVAWRAPLVMVPAVVALAGLLTLSHLDPATHWLRLVPLAAGAVAVGVGLAAALRHGGEATPGDLAGVVTLSVTVLVVVVDPLRRWVTVAPLGDAPHVGRTVLLWTAIVIAGGAVTVACTRDPAQPSRPWRMRRTLRHHTQGEST
jgi:hypothetical protein